MIPEKEMSPTDYLEHYGKKGMKWGIRNKSRSDRGANPPGQKKKLSAQEIRDARKRVKAQDRVVRSQVKAVKTASKQQRKAVRQNTRVEVAKIRTAALANPDRLTALTLTRGEKAANNVLLFVPGGAKHVITADITRELQKSAVKSALLEKQKR